MQNSFDSTSAVMLGGRCNSKEITHDVHGSANDDCSDVNPGALHVVMTNFLGLTTLPLIEDRTANYEVWNQPVVGYEITKQDEGHGDRREQVRRRDRQHVDVQHEREEAVRGPHDGHVRRRGLRRARRRSASKDNISTDDYHYILEVGSTGKVIGGRYCTDTREQPHRLPVVADRHVGLAEQPERRRRERQEARQARGRVPRTTAAAAAARRRTSRSRRARRSPITTRRASTSTSRSPA